MPKLSDKDFEQVVAELQKTTIGAALIQDYEPVKDSSIKDLDGNDAGDPTEHNAFVISCRQYQRPGGIAHTRIDIRGPDGLIHTSYEQDHVLLEPIDDAVGKPLLADVVYNIPSTRLGALPNEFESAVLFTKGAVLQPAWADNLRERRIARVPTKLLTADEISAKLKPFLELDHVIAGEMLAASDLAILGSISKVAVEARVAAAVEAAEAGVKTKP